MNTMFNVFKSEGRMQILKDWTKDKKLSLLAIAFIIIFVVGGVVTLPEYGLTWDEGTGNLFFGERYLNFFISFDPAYLDFTNKDLQIHQRPLNLYESPFRTRPQEFPPLADILSATTMEILSYRFNWLDPIDAFHLATVLLCGVLLSVLFFFARPRLGTLTAFLGILMLGTYPRFWGDMHFNPKDIPETVFFALTIIMFVTWFEKPSWQRALGVGVLFGSALSVKANALFIPIVLIIGVLPWQLTWQPWTKVWQHLKEYYGHYGLMITSGLFVHIISWPYLYADPLRLQNYYRYIFSQGERQGTSQWNWGPLIQTLTTMPEVMLALLIFGLLLAIKHNIRLSEFSIIRLLVVWTALPIVRTSLPGMVNFDGIRHFEEFLPAACLLAAYGGTSIVEWASKTQPKKRWAWSAGLFLLVGLNIASIATRYSPYEYLYYNSLVGGISGANREHKFPEATDYWGSSYRKGMRWLNANAEPNAVLNTSIADWIVRLPAPIWLRKDISVIPAEAVSESLKTGKTVYIMFITRVGWYDYIARGCEERLIPVHEISVNGVSILKIYRLVQRSNNPNR
jgi:hypothetical protein